MPLRHDSALLCRSLRLAVPLLVFAAFALWCTFPLIWRLDDAVPGLHAGDNLAALWNVWWFHYARSHGEALYWTDKLFAPYGTQLSLHTHATTHSAIAWLWTGSGSVVAAHNVALLVGLTLNGFCAYLLAFRLTDRVIPACAAGISFSCSAFVQVHLLGHVNLVHAWVIPLFALALIRLEATPGPFSAAAAGVAAAIVVYTDYYYIVFCAGLALVWLAARTVSLRIERRTPRSPLVIRSVLLLLAAVLLVVLAIAFTGGTTLTVGGLVLSLRTTRNPLTAFWLLWAVWVLLRYRFHVHARSPSSLSWPSPRGWLMAAGALILCVVLTLPVGKALLDVMRSGEYVTQRILWRSSPPGADAATLVLGHPRHALTGEVTRAAYDALQIDALEQSLWLGLVPLAVVAGWRRHWRGDPHAPVWLGVALVFGALAMGPFLRVAGIDTALPLPGALTRYIPIASNARIPGRAVIVLQLATAVLFALALKHRRPGRGLLSATAAFLILESAVAPAPIYPLPPADNVDRILAQSPSAGAVVELPSGLRDGFGELGAFDHRALVHQITHERPLVGGFVARLPPDLRRRYLETSVLRELIEPAAGSSADATLADDTAARARASGIAFLVVNRDVLAAGAYPRAALERAGFEFVHADGSRELYRSFRQ